ncbi:hypothetical protein VKT23_006861 [Stygiomarasmius scandens]|uniref:Uncharacterized protein n=1 Tax=Marasmiellus scandens TaxID=2682957 RepID=A0ABR1JNL2_9AGAR
MHDNDPEVLETEKRRNLNKEQHRTSAPFGEHAPGWNEHLASASEAHVKADRAPASSEDLTRDTIDYLQRRHSPDDRGQSTESYAKDQVDGPLGAASYETRERIDGPLGQAQTQKTVEKDVHETTRIYKTKSVPTDSEETVKADRGEI